MLTGQNTGSWQWSMKVKGIENYEVYDAKFDSNNPSIIYAADLDSGIIKSADGGKTWLRKDNGMNPYVSNCVSTSTYNCMAQGDAAYVEVAPSDNPAQPSIVFSSINHWSSSSSNDRLLPSNPYRSFQDKYGITSAGCRIFKSMDGGETWADKSNGLPPPCSTTNGATNSMIWKIIYNKKGNLLFLTQKRVPINDQECQDVRHPSTSCSTAEMSNNLYPPVYMSRDLGETWQALPEAGLPDGSYSRNGLGYDEGTGELFYGVYNSIDGTKGLYKIKPLTETSWTKLTINQPSFDTKSITDMYTKNNRIYLGYKSSGYGFRLLISQDNGNSWTLGNGGNYFTDGKMNSAEGFISVDPNDISHVFVTFNNWWSKPNMGVFESIDGGQTFTQRNQGLDFTDVYHIAFHPTDPNKLLLMATGGGGMFFSYVP
ncbi:MAG: hypothetical protein HZB67_03025 [Candidatus Aenigmarchaeota archaeon]|nr:hypothetical protein [Candidatus Aenigmarchaeota archaeon]